MGISFSLFYVFLIFFLTPPSKSVQDYTTLVYKGCSKQPISDPTGLLTQSLSNLFTSLTQQSSRSKFFKTTSSGGSQSTISGLYQCRADLTNGDCYKCVTKLPQLFDQLCGKVMAARVHLLGCYMSYEVSGFTQISGFELIYKVCSPTNVAGSGFEMRRDSALAVLQNGLAKNGFYSTTFESFYVVGQCEGDLVSSDCAQCVKVAVQKSQVECGSSLSGQVYLQKCFISYSYSPNGVPTKASSYKSSSSSGYSSGQLIIQGRLLR